MISKHLHTILFGCPSWRCSLHGSTSGQKGKTIIEWSSMKQLEIISFFFITSTRNLRANNISRHQMPCISKFAKIWKSQKIFIVEKLRLHFRTTNASKRISTLPKQEQMGEPKATFNPELIRWKPLVNALVSHKLHKLRGWNIKRPVNSMLGKLNQTNMT